MRRILLPLLAVLALLVAGCGSSGSAGSGGSDPASVAPRGAILYGSATVRPEGSLKASVEAAGRKVLAGRELGPAIQSLLERALRSGHLDYTADVKPWLGRHVAFYISNFSAGSTAGAAIVETTDGGKAKAAVDKAEKAGGGKLVSRSYSGQDYTVGQGNGTPDAYGILNGFLVIGTEAGFRAAVDAVKGDALADSDAFKTATGQVAKDGLALFYIDTPHLIDAAAQASPRAAIVLGQLRGLPQLQNLKPTAAAVTVDGNAITVEAPHKAGDPAVADAIEKLPADSWLAFAAPKAGDTIRRQVKAIAGLAGGDVLGILDRQLQARAGLTLQKDLLSWIGSVSGYATGTSLLDLNAALVITSTDPATSRRTVRKLAALAQRSARVPVRSIPGGISFLPPNSPAPISFAEVGDKVVFAYGKDGIRRALKPSGTLKGSASYAAAQKALGGGRPSFLLYMPSILQLAQGLGAGKSAGFQKALPYLQAYTAIAFGSAQEDGHTVGRLSIGLK